MYITRTNSDNKSGAWMGEHTGSTKEHSDDPTAGRGIAKRLRATEVGEYPSPSDAKRLRSGGERQFV